MFSQLQTCPKHAALFAQVFELGFSRPDQLSWAKTAQVEVSFERCIKLSQ